MSRSSLEHTALEAAFIELVRIHESYHDGWGSQFCIECEAVWPYAQLTPKHRKRCTMRKTAKLIRTIRTVLSE